ncbi:transcriptional regulator BetI [Devosia psychrophila]|uniref:HTH-type transcriptional regulator BetI n=1 Tax=Devosia psychrophila TaxID=728005 RepID=A0A0F5PUY3_9HYPH|nr:transcriptional regulator BetI [Devosia psychrophila]KKC32425.1 BetI family transcriptional regulator [Devosia psychrophila]SFC13310.1 transcriptional regulator, TetR family [Devosia psychrophila]
MPKIGAGAVRRKAMIEATIVEIGEAGSLDVTVSQIARRAGMSPALAHHYFGSKDQMFLAAMRHILRLYGESVRRRMGLVYTPVLRIHAIIDASFAPDQFDREVVAAWLTFYVRALQSQEASRLLQVYARRLHSNLVFNLRQLVDGESAQSIAQGLAAIIDGFYIRHALQDFAPAQEEVRAMVLDYLDLCLTRSAARV